MKKINFVVVIADRFHRVGRVQFSATADADARLPRRNRCPLSCRLPAKCCLNRGPT